VLLDVRRAAHDADSFEAAVSAAASIVAANGAQRDLVRLVTTDGADSGFGSGGTHVQALLEHLAVIDTSGSASLRTMLDLLRRDGQGALVVVVGRTAQDDLRAAARLRQRFGLVTVVQVTDDAGAPGAPAASATLVRVTPSSPFAPAWDRAMRAASSRRARAGVGT